MNVSKGIIKKIFIVILLLAIIIPYFPIAVFADNTENNDFSDKINFSVRWKSGKEIETGSAELEYVIVFNGVQTGFRNIKVFMETNKVENLIDSISCTNSTEGAGWAQVNYGSKNTGTSISGDANVYFGNPTEIMNRTVNIKLTGEYTDPETNEVINFDISKELKAVITPATAISDFSTELNWQGIGTDYIPYLSEDKVTIKNGWYDKSVTATYPITISAFTYTQKFDLKITINRYKYEDNSKVSQISDGYTINWDGLDELLGEPAKIENEDGSISYLFSKGQDSDVLDKSKTFTVKSKLKNSKMNLYGFNIVIKYDTPKTNPLEETNPEANFNCSFLAEMEAIGFSTKKEYGKDEVVSKKTEKKSLYDTKSKNLLGYTPGQHSWKTFEYTSVDVDNESAITDTVVENIKKNRTIKISTKINKISEASGETDYQEGLLKIKSPILYYQSDNGQMKSIVLSGTQMKADKITAIANGTNYYVYNNEKTEFNGTYTFGENETVNKFSIQMNDFLNKYFYSYQIEYTLDIDKVGLTDTEIENIAGIDFNMETSGQWLYGGKTLYLERQIAKKENKLSFMSFQTDFADSADNLNIKVASSITISMAKPESMKDTAITHNFVVNENPVFYVELPSMYTYKNFKITSSKNATLSIDEENLDIIKKNGVKYLVIPCKGTYNSDIDDSINININFNRTLVDPSNGEYTLDVYMLTDNENYYKKGVPNVYEFEKTEIIPSKIFKDEVKFSILGYSELKANTIIEANNRIYGNENVGQKNNPIISDFSNNSIIYKSEISAVGDDLTNVEILSRLPFANNTFIENSDTQLIETDYNKNGELSDFIDNYGGKLKGVTKNTAIPQLTFSNIKILGVYEINKINTNENSEHAISKDNYQIYYTTEEKADFDSTSFIRYEEGVSDLSKARNIKVVFKDENNKNYEIKSNHRVYLKYEVTMPDEQGMVGAVCSVRYDRVKMANTETLHSKAGYIINGETTGTIKVQKKFENYEVGKAPTGVSLEGIEFKLQYLDESTSERKFLQDSNGNDIVAKTNSSGIATFENIPVNDYYLYESTEFTEYSGIGKINLITVNPAETINYTAVNLLKRGTITVTKNWESAKDQPGSVSFQLIRANSSGEKFAFTTKTATTDENGQAVFEDIPYGKYTVKETSCVDGWAPSVESKTVTLNSDTAQVIFINIRARAVLQIVKTVPTGESVDGLTFHIVGRGKVSYTDNSGNIVNSDSEYTIKIGDNYPNNVSVSKSEDGSSATITIKDLYLGYYTIEEIDIPTIDGTDIKKYSPVNASVLLEKHDFTNPVIVNLSNRYKMGYLKINKTAKLKEGGKYTDIGDLTGFQVRITGKSYYGHDVDDLITLDENGYGIGKYEIGEYTVTEVPADGYTAYYGLDNTASTTPPKVTIEQNKTITQNLYNEHTGMGYVRVEKSLEGVKNPQAVIKAGIKFKISGQNVAGGRVNETILIDKIDEQNEVAYGISGPISSGGEYEISEDESTIPEFYEGMEPEKIEITTSNTEQSPLIKKVVNNRTKGNLEIVTTTNPEGGNLKGISYKVTEVELGENGTYKAVGTPVNVEGSNNDIDPSFAKLENINAGYYLVEQDKIPSGWIKDVNQIVEVPSYNTGYANFEITERKKLKANKVTINKILLNENGEQASDEDIEKAELNKDEMFEIKITNIETQENYYVFTSLNNPGVIQGLDAGTYSIEEVFKPKYLIEGYYKNIELQGQIPEQGTQNAEEKIELNEGKYTFSITQNGNVTEDVNLTVKNKIDTAYGFGGQKNRNNLSKIDTVEEPSNYVTKAVIWVVDENGDAISGVKFNLLTAQGSTVSLNGKTEFEIANKKLIIKGLPVGTYILKCISVPDGYIKPDNEQIVVYSDATQVARVEIQKDIPRGSLSLSTTYKDLEGNSKFVSRSKYKVVDTKTGELVKFVRTATGDYKKSNIEDASPVIVLKSGAVNVEGIETGDYEVGIVDVTKGYGIQKTEVEKVNIEENVNKKVNVEVANMQVSQVDAGENTTMYLNNNGELFIKGASYYGEFGNGESSNYSSQFVKIEFPISNVKIKKFVTDKFGVLAIDSEGRIWTWGYGNVDGLIQGYSCVPTCITENGLLRDEYYENETRFVDIELSSSSYGDSIILDNKGRVWAVGYNIGSLKLITDFTEKNITIKKLAKLKSNGGSCNIGVIDTLGRVWMWSFNTAVSGLSNLKTSKYTPICISEISDENPIAPLNEVVINDLLISESFAIAVDSKGELWMWGSSGVIVGQLTNGLKPYPTKVDSSYFGNAKIKEIAGSMGCSNMGVATASTAIVIDENGKVWTWGDNSYGELGNGTKTASTIPVCISDDKNDVLYGVEMKQIEVSCGTHVVGLDTNGTIWAWGGNSTYGQAGVTDDTNGITVPQTIDTFYNEHFEYNLKFKKVESDSNSYNKFAIDEEGKVWVWGNNYGSALGIDNNYKAIKNPTVLAIPGNPKIKKISAANTNATIMVSEDGRVYVAGDCYLGNGLETKRLAITEITNNFNLSKDVYISDVETFDGFNEFFIAIDSEGKVYTWGKSNSPLGRSDLSDPLTIECISDDVNEPLYGVKIKKISQKDDTIFAISEDGKLYTWTKSEKPTLQKCDEEFVDSSKGILLDKNGKIWTYRDRLICYSNNPYYNVLYKKYQTDPDYRITNLYKHWYTGDYAIIRDSNGDWWVVSGGNLESYNVGVKNVISLSCKVSIDNYGQIWEMTDNGLRCLSDCVTNNLYNVKMNRIISNTQVADEQGNLWEFYEDRQPQKIGISAIDYMEKTLGLTIVEKNEVNYRPLALDDKGKIWWGDKQKVECVSDIENTEFADKYKDSNFKIVKLYSTCAIDNSGKVWKWNPYGRPEPKCISEISGGVSNIKYSPNGTIIAEDSNGNAWLWENNNSGVIGDGSKTTRTTPYNVNKEILNGKKIKLIKIEMLRGLIICEDGSIYVSGDSNLNGQTKWTFMGICEGATNGFVTSRKAYIITGENKTWTFGTNCSGSYKGMCGTGNITDQYIKIPTLISNEFTVADLISDERSILDTNGNVWYWRDSITPTKVLSDIVAKNSDRNSSDAVIDINGIVHYDYNNRTTGKTKDNSEEIKKIYGNLNKDNIIKFSKLSKNSGTLYYKNINGKVWKFNIGNIGNYVDSCECFSESLGSEMKGKEIIDYLGNKAIDSEGNLYVWTNYTGLNYTAGYPKNFTQTLYYSEAVIKANGTIINNPSKNELYGIKVKQLINDKFIIDENNDIWYFTPTGEPFNISQEQKGDENPLYGKKFARPWANSSNYILTEDNEVWYIGGSYPGKVMDFYSGEYDYSYESSNFYIVLDKQGKIWTCGVNAYGLLGNGGYTTNNEIVCLNDIEGTELYNAKMKDSNFKIKNIIKISNDSSVSSDYNCIVYAVDNSNKLWVWGSANRSFGYNIKYLAPTCLTDKEECTLHDAYYNDNIQIVDVNGSNFKDNTGELWSISLEDFNNWKRCTESLLENGRIDDNIGAITQYKYEAILSKDGTVYVENCVTGKYSIANKINSSIIEKVNVIGELYRKTTTSSGLSRRIITFYAIGDNDLYFITTSVYYQSGKYSDFSISIKNMYSNQESKVKNYIESSDGYSGYLLVLYDDGKLYQFSALNNSSVELTNKSGSPIYGKQIKDIEKVGGTIFITDSDGVIYAITSKDMYNNVNPHIYTEGDYIAEALYGEATNETRRKVIDKMKTNSYLFVENGKAYLNQNGACKESVYMNEFLNGIGKIDSVVGEDEIKTKDGKIYKITPTQDGKYTIAEVETTTEFSTAEPDETITIKGVNIIKQTKHKALDDEGNLYVWDSYTGLKKYINEVTCLTKEEYSKEPIYLHGNGWSIITASK